MSVLVTDLGSLLSRTIALHGERNSKQDAVNFCLKYYVVTSYLASVKLFIFHVDLVI